MIVGGFLAYPDVVRMRFPDAGGGNAAEDAVVPEFLDIAAAVVAKGGPL